MGIGDVISLDDHSCQSKCSERIVQLIWHTLTMYSHAIPLYAVKLEGPIPSHQEEDKDPNS